MDNKIIGRFIPLGQDNDWAKPFFVLTKEPSDYLAPAWEGIKPDGEEYHVIESAWKFEPIEWDGEGLPLVGCECEYETNGYGIKKVRVECITMDGIAFTWLGEDPKFRGLDCINTSQSHRFRPIRSEADKKRDEAIKKICEVLSVGKNTEDDAKNIYEYIKSGKIVID